MEIGLRYGFFGLVIVIMILDWVGDLLSFRVRFGWFFSVTGGYAASGRGVWLIGLRVSFVKSAGEGL